MDEKNYRRLRRMFVAVWFTLIILSVIVLWALLAQPKREINNYIGQKGEQGQQGLQGIQGVQGEQGLPGESKIIEHTETVIQHTTVKGDKGEKGADGAPGASPMLRYNPDNNAIEQKYPDDRFWSVLVPVCDLVKNEACATSE